MTLSEAAAEANDPPNEKSGVLTPDTAAKGWHLDTELVKIGHRPADENTSSPVAFFHFLERLKTTKREGWRRFGIGHGESIADHMYRMSIMTMFAPPALSGKLDVGKCVKMALIHDMAESLVGDITPVDNVLKSEKSRREAETMDFLTKRLLGGVNGGMTGEQIRVIWQEYEDSETLESQFVHDIDKVELIHQMLEYERQHEGRLDLSEFSWVAQRIKNEEVKAWSDQLLQEREEYWGSLGKKAPHYDVGKNQVDLRKESAIREQYYGNGAHSSS